MTERSRAGAFAAVLVVALAVGGCGGSEGAPDAGGPTGTPSPSAPTTGDPGPTYEVPPPPPPVVGTAGGRRLAVTTWGSSSCPRGPVAVEVTGEQEVRVDIELLFPEREPCTVDMAPTTTEIDLPAGIDPDETLTVRLDHGDGVEETVELVPADG